MRRITPSNLKKLLARELEDQVPCFYRDTYGDYFGKGKYLEVVIDGLSDIIFYVYTKDDPATDEKSEIEIIQDAVEEQFSNIIEDYFDDSDCSEYNKEY
jgi:hypothetical protein